MSGSIATKKGDNGQTSLAGGIRTSKSSIRVEAYGTVDELNSVLGFARSICEDTALCDLTKEIQRELFEVGSSLATPPESRKGQAPITEEAVERLTAEVHRLEGLEGMLSDWSLPGGHPTGAAFDVARTVCRRAERCIVRLLESGEGVQPTILPYLNRLSDLLWLLGRKIEHDAGVSSSLREINSKAGNRWSKAW
ncbi:MAG: cob(I)yrinic acid a,c-diamide adenosyltransferase [Candidatus Korobacteraceae bacterium]